MSRIGAPSFWTPATTWLALAALAAAGMLGVAHAFETFGHYPPCELCYSQRDAHWAALWVSLAGLMVGRFRPAAARWVCVVVGLVFVVSTGLASYHAGVEWKWWPGPSTCTGAHIKAVTAADMAALLGPTKTHIVRCDEAAWRMFGISMAGYNALASLVFAILSFSAAAQRPARG